MIKISDLSLSDKVLEKQYSVVQVSEWTERNGEEVVKKGWKYEVVLPKLRFEKFSIKIESHNLIIKPYATANNGFVTIGISANAKSAVIVS